MITERMMSEVGDDLLHIEETVNSMKMKMAQSATIPTADENLISNALSDVLGDCSRARAALERQQRIIADEPIAQVFRDWMNESFVSDDNVPAARSAFADVRGSAHHLISYLRGHGVVVMLRETSRIR